MESAIQYPSAGHQSILAVDHMVPAVVTQRFHDTDQFAVAEEEEHRHRILVVASSHSPADSLEEHAGYRQEDQQPIA